MVVDGLLIKRVHFVGLGPSSGCPNVIGDFSGILARIGSRRYSKILMRGFHDPDFVYDYYLWSKSSGIRNALLENYRETGKIRAVEPPLAVQNTGHDPYYFGQISILEPRINAPER